MFAHIAHTMFTVDSHSWVTPVFLLRTAFGAASFLLAAPNSLLLDCAVFDDFGIDDVVFGSGIGWCGFAGLWQEH